jgi:hypothetical protein
MTFDPNKLTYGNEGVPILKATEIEQIATQVLEKHCPLVLQKPEITPVNEIIKRLGQTTKLESAIADLGTKGNAKILGKVNFPLRLLSLDRVLTTERKTQMQFTAAHEVGHWILHRWNYKMWRFPSSKVTPDNLEDDDDSLAQRKRRSPREWLEWQANVFAASLIMPRETFRTALIQAQKSIGITRNLGIVWVSEEEYSKRDLLLVARGLSGVYDVSVTSVLVRLNRLELTCGQPFEN